MMMVRCHNVSFIQVSVNDAVGMPKQKDYDFFILFFLREKELGVAGSRDGKGRGVSK